MIFINIMSGIKDFGSVESADSTRIHLQKRLILTNLNEIHQMPKKEHKTEKVCF